MKRVNKNVNPHVKHCCVFMFPESSMLCHYFIFEPSGVQISTKTDSKTCNVKSKNTNLNGKCLINLIFPLKL